MEFPKESDKPHPITKFTYRGKIYDCTHGVYAIYNSLRVSKKGKLVRLDKDPKLIGLNINNVRIRFSLARLWLAVTKPLPEEIEAASGIRVVDHSLPDNDARKYDWETPYDRIELQRARQASIDALVTNPWKTLVYGSDVFTTHEISRKTCEIRNVKTGKILVPKNGRLAIVHSKMIHVHRAYMYTFEAENRMPHQDQVDHINGDHLDNSPCNLRWASSMENKLYVHKAMALMEKGVPYTGDFQGLKKFRGWYFGMVNGEYAVIDTHKRLRTVGDFRTSSRIPYPIIVISGKKYRVHRIVALVEGIITPEQFDTPSNDAIVMHLDDDKTNFRPENLRLGTFSENNVAVQSNPATSKRKRVRQLDNNGTILAEFECARIAAKIVDGSMGCIRQAYTKQSCYKGYRWKLV